MINLEKYLAFKNNISPFFTSNSAYIYEGQFEVLLSSFDVDHNIKLDAIPYKMYKPELGVSLIKHFEFVFCLFTLFWLLNSDYLKKNLNN